MSKLDLVKGVNMAHKRTIISNELYSYVLEHSATEDLELKALRLESEKHEYDQMRSTPEHAQLLQILAKMISAELIVEIGVFTGYVTLALAQALGRNGKVIALDNTEQFVNIGKPFWLKSSAGNKIDLRIGLALDSLQAMLERENMASKVDMIFLDADKPSYPVYYELALKLLRPGGLIAIDNTLFHGAVLDESTPGDSTPAIRKLNKIVRDDTRVDMIMLPLADGLTLALKK